MLWEVVPVGPFQAFTFVLAVGLLVVGAASLFGVYSVRYGTGSLRAFVAAKPLQALKFVLAGGTIVIGAAGVFGVYAPLDGVRLLGLVGLVGMLFAVVVASEVFYGLVRRLTADATSTAVRSARPGYAPGRAVEVVGAAVGATAIVDAFATGNAASPPAAVGLVMMVGAGGALVVVASSVRCLGDLYSFRHRRAVDRS